jgi:hypothetical protein
MWKQTFRRATFYADLSKLCVAKNYGLAEVLFSFQASHWILRLSDKNIEIRLADLHIQSSLFLLLETTV